MLNSGGSSNGYVLPRDVVINTMSDLDEIVSSQSVGLFPLPRSPPQFEASLLDDFRAPTENLLTILEGDEEDEEEEEDEENEEDAGNESGQPDCGSATSTHANANPFVMDDQDA
jgi:hypothetical protein